ncbi:MAG TPA: phage holin family protein, partial [Longimicrobiales bacterium]|nr:phage holin family protein [Longimicrobiales bacterium]
VFALVTTIIALLGQFMAVWLAALLVTVALAAGAYFLVHKGIETIQQTELAPRETIETVREDVVWLKKRR